MAVTAPNPNHAARLAASVREAARLAWDSLRAQPARSGLAIGGVVIGIVTVVLVASVLVGLRNSVAQLFRELGHLEHESQAAKAQATTALAQLEHERRRVAQVEEQLAQARALAEEQLARARAQAAEEQARAARLEAIARAPWYAVRVRRRLRRELAEVG